MSFKYPIIGGDDDDDGDDDRKEHGRTRRKNSAVTEWLPKGPSVNESKEKQQKCKENHRAAQ